MELSFSSRLLVAARRDATVVPIATAAVPELFSAWIGCRIAPLWTFGVDLAALCPRRIR
jgi:hypothetical protein